MGEDTFTTSTGRVIKLRRVARRHVERIRAKHKLPEIPTYTFEAAGGEMVTEPHNETTLNTPDDHKKWNEYQRDLARVLAEQQHEVLSFLIYHCVDEEAPPPEQWSVDFGQWGLEAPDPADKISYKVEWFESEICVDREDFSRIAARLYEMGGLVGTDKIDELEKFFRAALVG